MLPQVKVLAVQAWYLEINPLGPHKGGKTKTSPCVLWPPHVHCGTRVPTVVHSQIRTHVIDIWGGKLFCICVVFIG